MNNRKSVFSGIISITGIIVLAVLAVLYSFTEIAIPAPVYALAWCGCIAAVLAATRS